MAFVSLLTSQKRNIHLIQKSSGIDNKFAV